MCGIAGIIGKDRRSYDRVAERMSESIAHRGPDGSGSFVDNVKGLFLFHKRLSIIDLSDKGNQPILNENKDKVLLANCEIYNYKELREKLQAKSHVFYSNTDAEVIIHAYEEYGIDFLSYLNGMFAIAIWDIKKGELILARDQIGIKPLYYINNAKIFAFSSEIKSFLKLDNNIWDKEIYEEKLENLVFFPYILDNENTIFKEVKKVPPGMVIIYNNGKLKIKRYWVLEKKDYGVIGFSQSVERCEELLKSSVNKQLQADVPVGILLSGGLDSSLIYSLARQSTKEVHIFTARYEHKLDESHFARRVSIDAKGRYYEINIDVVKQIGNRLEEIMVYFDDLSTLDGGFFMNYLIAEQIKHYKIKVLLVGDGADELFGGYSWYGLSQFPFNFLPLYFKTCIYYYALSRRFSSFKCIKYINDIYKKMETVNGDIFTKISNYELGFQLPNHFLARADKATMAHGIEARVPYLDVDLVNFVYSLPKKFKIKGNIFNFNAVNEKCILREIAKKYLPREIYTRKKYGFSIPMSAVLKFNKQKVRDYLLENDSIALRYFNKNEILRMVEFKEKMYQPLEKEKEFLLWRFFLISIYMKCFMN